MTKKASTRGFTLIELLVAMSLLVSVSVVMVRGLHHIRRVIDIVDQQTAVKQRARTLLSCIQIVSGTPSTEACAGYKRDAELDGIVIKWEHRFTRLQWRPASEPVAIDTAWSPGTSGQWESKVTLSPTSQSGYPDVTQSILLPSLPSTPEVSLSEITLHIRLPE